MIICVINLIIGQDHVMVLGLAYEDNLHFYKIIFKLCFFMLRT